MAERQGERDGERAGERERERDVLVWMGEGDSSGERKVRDKSWLISPLSVAHGMFFVLIMCTFCRGVCVCFWPVQVDPHECEQT